MEHPGAAAVTLSISAVERDTGLSKDTLRVWERRYGFPSPMRDAFGERIYPLEQVDRLRAIRRLMDIGHRPGKIIGLDIAELQALADTSTGTGSSIRSDMEQDSNPDLLHLVDITKIPRYRRATPSAWPAALKTWSGPLRDRSGCSADPTGRGCLVAWPAGNL